MGIAEEVVDTEIPATYGCFVTKNNHSPPKDSFIGYNYL
jgi:hypothetical protein